MSKNYGKCIVIRWGEWPWQGQWQRRQAVPCAASHPPWPFSAAGHPAQLRGSSLPQQGCSCREDALGTPCLVTLASASNIHYKGRGTAGRAVFFFWLNTSFWSNTGSWAPNDSKNKPKSHHNTFLQDFLELEGLSPAPTIQLILGLRHPLRLHSFKRWTHNPSTVKQTPHVMLPRKCVKWIPMIWY